MITVKDTFVSSTQHYTYTSIQIFKYLIRLILYVCKQKKHHLVKCLQILIKIKFERRLIMWRMPRHNKLQVYNDAFCKLVHCEVVPIWCFDDFRFEAMTSSNQTNNFRFNF